MTNEDRIRALEKIAKSGYDGWAGSNRISNDKASDIVAAYGNALREDEKDLKSKANTQVGLGATSLGLGAAAGGYAASRLPKIVRPPAGISRGRIAGKAGIAGLISAGLLYAGKNMYDKHISTGIKAKQVGQEAEATENWVNYFNGIKGKLR